MYVGAGFNGQKCLRGTIGRCDVIAKKNGAEDTR